jgi:hypothetical protein
MRLKRNPRKETSTVWDYGTRCDICKKEIRIRHFERADINIQANPNTAKTAKKKEDYFT